MSRRYRDDLVADYRRMRASCPDCGAIGLVYRDMLGPEAGAWRLHDPSDLVLDEFTEAVGVDAVLAQGIGPANGGRHQCPPFPRGCRTITQVEAGGAP